MVSGTLVIRSILFLTGLVAGLVDTVAGGGGLLTLPVLLGIGLPPREALGTNKLQASFGSGSATAHFVAAGEVRLGDCLYGAACTALGAAMGALSVQVISPRFLGRVIPFFLIALSLYLMASPGAGFHNRRPRLTSTAFHTLFGLGLGFYDGFFGPGTGSFWAYAYVIFLGFDLKTATVHTKVMNFVSNIVSLSLFLAAGNVHYTEGLIMAAGQVAGARIGSRLVIRRGAGFIRPVLAAITLAISAKLLYDNYR